MSNSVRIFIGSEPKTEIAKKVLEFSILKHTSIPVEFPGLDSTDSWREKAQRKAPQIGTGFSLLRWDIPERCNWEGYAIYLDADIICLEDIVQLWRADVEFPNKKCSHWCTYQESKWFKHPTPETSVFFVNCEKAKYNQKTMEEIIDELQKDHDRSLYVSYMRLLAPNQPPQRIPDSYNRLNIPVKGKTKFLHYTKEPQQPWYNPKHKYSSIWRDYFVEALKEGYLDRELVNYALDTFEPHTSKKRGTGLHPDWKKYIN